MRIDIANHDLEAHTAEMDQAQRTIVRRTADAGRRLGQRIEDDAKAATPVGLTGRLQAGNTAYVEVHGDDVSAGAYNDVEYAPFIHDGTVHIGPIPFLTDALHRNTRAGASIWRDLADEAEF